MIEYELYELNSQLQYHCRCAVYVLRCQNYYAGMQRIQYIHVLLESFISKVLQNEQVLDGSMLDLLAQSLKSTIAAQEIEDYVLLADVLELHLLADLIHIQNTLREKIDFQNVEVKNWESNIEILAQKDRQFAEDLKNVRNMICKKYGESELSVWQEPTNSGAQTLATKDEKGTYYFHSNVDPYYEAWQFANWYYNPAKKEYVVYGLGLGYHIEALANMDESIKIRVFEQDIYVIYNFLCSRNQSSLLNNVNVHIIYDPKLKKLSDCLINSAVVIMHHPSLRHTKQKTIRERMEYMFIRDSGIHNQHNLMASNFRENQLNCKNNVDELSEQFRNKKVVIVAAGPSLDKNVNLLKQKPSDVLIVSTGTVFHKLMQLGIDVDYVIVSDAQPTIRSQFCRDFDKHVPILVLSTASKCVAAEYAGEKYIIYQKDYDLSENEANRSGHRVYETGGSVSTTALDVCLKFECLSVAYIGLDLAYTDNKGHAGGTTGTEEIDTTGMKLVPGYETEKTIAGNMMVKEIKLPSSHLFDMYRQWIERRVMRTTIPVFDATEGGSIVKGLEIISLKEYLCKQIEQEEI